MLCATCTSRYGKPVDYRTSTCGHTTDRILAPISRADLSLPLESLERAPRVDVVTLAHLWEQGRTTYALLRRNRWSPTTYDWQCAIQAISTPWGGVTIGPDGPVKPVTGYAVAIRARLEAPDSRPLDTSLPDGLPDVVTSPYLGVFRDEEAGRIDVDPVAIVATLREAQALSVYCRSTGGAYDFSTGNGYWTPTL